LKISTETIEEVKKRIDIVDVIGDFVQLKKSGSTYRAKSPFTDERTPSFFVVPHKDLFKDFSSGKAGDAITFVMEHDGLSYIESITYLAKKYGVEIKEEEIPNEQLQQQYNERESLFIVLNFAKEHYKVLLHNHKEGKSIGYSYFKERGFDNQIIEKFELGYALNDWDNLLQTAIQKGYKKEILDKAGLISIKDDKSYDRFRGRVIFPIHNSTGKTIAFGARTLSKDKKQPKYLNSPETDVYHKSNILYGIFQARQAIRKEDKCYLVEGYTDVISMHQAGVENVVASSGTALTKEQIKLIGRHSENITVLFDGDEAGMRASIRGIDMILEEGMNVRIIPFPDGEDPDSYAKKIGPFNFKEFLKNNEQDFIRFKAELFTKNAQNDPIKKADAINEIVESISKVPDPVRRQVYIKECASILQLGEDVLIAEMNNILLSKHSKEDIKLRRERAQAVSHEAEHSKKEEVEELLEQQLQKVDPLELQERECIKILVNYGFNEIENQYKLIDHYLEELENIEFKTPILNEILNIFRNEVKKGTILGLDDFYKISSNEIKMELLKHFDSIKYTVSENWQKHKIFPPNEYTPSQSAYVNILRLKFRKIRELFFHNQEQLKKAGTDNVEDLLKISMELKKMEMEFAKPLGIVIS